MFNAQRDKQAKKPHSAWLQSKRVKVLHWSVFSPDVSRWNCLLLNKNYGNLIWDSWATCTFTSSKICKEIHFQFLTTSWLQSPDTLCHWRKYLCTTVVNMLPSRLFGPCFRRRMLLQTIGFISLSNRFLLNSTEYQLKSILLIFFTFYTTSQRSNVHNPCNSLCFNTNMSSVKNGWMSHLDFSNGSSSQRQTDSNGLWKWKQRPVHRIPVNRGSDSSALTVSKAANIKEHRRVISLLVWIWIHISRC